jgi:colicin import membrane protein
MSRARPVQWLSDRLITGLSDLPENASWLMQRALAPSENTSKGAGSVMNSARDRARSFRASVTDVLPVTDSVESRMQQARAAAERAQEAEAEALEASRVSKQRSEHARQVAEAGRTRLAQSKQEADLTVKEREARARHAADEAVKRELEAARADADAQVRATQSDVAEEMESAREEAQEAEERAKNLVAEAARYLEEAQRVADEAREAAVAAADEAHRAAQRLQADVSEQVKNADARVTAANRVGQQTTVTAERIARELQTDKLDSDLDSLTKAELLDLAAAIDIDGRTTMSKTELVTAIAKTSGAKN